MTRTISWQQVAALAVFLASIVAILVLVPASKLPPWEMVLAFVTAALSGGASAFLPSIVSRTSPARESAPRDPGPL